MRALIRLFVFLDLISMVFLAMQLWYTANHFNELSNQLSVKVASLLMFPMFLLILGGVVGLYKVKKFGFIIYYIQFPFRLYLWVFSVGFITLLPAALSYYEDKWFEILLKVCMTAEFMRLYLTIRAQLKISNEKQ